MIKISKITGKADLIRKINTLMAGFDHSTYQGLMDASILLRDKSIQYLKDHSIYWGLSAEGGSISDTAYWRTIRESNTKIKLECFSGHAAVVEFGGLGGQGGSDTVTGYVERSTKTSPPGPYPIGLQQRQAPIFRWGFAIQQPKSYFRNSINSEAVQTSMRTKVKHQLQRTIREICH